MRLRALPAYRLDEEIRAGNITPEMAAVSNLQSVITRAIGVADCVEPDLFAANLLLGDMLLLASDGLTRYAHVEEIAGAAAASSDLTAICQSLIDYAEGPPLGIILCAGASTRQIELLELDSAGIHVAEYLTVLPPRDVLERKLKDAIGAARLRFEGRELENS